jgi:predicted secreted protein
MLQYGSLVAVYFVVWWISFVAVLQIGNRSQIEAGDVAAGTEPGAPVNPHMLRRILITSVLAAIVTALLLWGMSNETLNRYWYR